MPAEVESLVTTEDVAAYLKKSPNWIRDNAARLDIPRFKVGTQYRYRLSEVARWVEVRRKTLDAVTGK